MTVRKIPTLDSGNLIPDKFMPARLGATALATADVAVDANAASALRVQQDARLTATFAPVAVLPNALRVTDRNPLAWDTFNGAAHILNAALGAYPVSGQVATNAVLTPGAGGTINPLFRYTKSKPVIGGAGSPDNQCVVSSGVTSPNSSPPLAVHFHTTATTLYITRKGNGAYSSMHVAIDGKAIPCTDVVSPDHVHPGPPSTGNFYQHTITLPSTSNVRDRHVTLTASGYFYFIDASVPSGQTAVTKCTCDLGPRVVVLGDSFAEPTFGGEAGKFNNGFALGILNPVQGFPDRMGREAGWFDVWCSGSGGTGYIATGSGGRVKFLDRVSADVIAPAPEVVIVAGGINDVGLTTPAAVGAAAGAVYDAIRAGLPNAAIVVVGPFWPRGTETTNADILAMNAAIKAAALARGLRFLDPMGSNWVTTANTGKVTGTDTTHPTVYGHGYLGRLVARGLGIG